LLIVSVAWFLVLLLACRRVCQVSVTIHLHSVVLN